jgi:hypothetical protein
VIASYASDLSQTGLDACTLNNALNVAQLIALVVLIRWLRTGIPNR